VRGEKYLRLVKWLRCGISFRLQVRGRETPTSLGRVIEVRDFFPSSGEGERNTSVRSSDWGEDFFPSSGEGKRSTYSVGSSDWGEDHFPSSREGKETPTPLGRVIEVRISFRLQVRGRETPTPLGRVIEWGSLSVLRWGGNTYSVEWLRWAFFKGPPKKIDVSLPPPKDGNIQFPKRCVLQSTNPAIPSFLLLVPIKQKQDLSVGNCDFVLHESLGFMNVIRI
jgi:hypothetical protein